METLAEWFPNLTLGFATAVSPINLLYCFLGVFVGTLIGVLPGIGPLAAIAMLLPITFNLPPVGALIMLAGIYYGAQYGGSTTASKPKQMNMIPAQKSSWLLILNCTASSCFLSRLLARTRQYPLG